MINPACFYEILKKQDINFFTGVPDSLLKDYCAYVMDNTEPEDHIITANEGGAVALAAGYHLATGKTALVYMQNSGFGNAVNPLLSLADPDVYSIPMLLVIGWRGEPGVKDEPQHVKQGKVQLKMLEALDIPYDILDGSSNDPENIINNLCKIMRKQSRPCALLVRKGAFEQYKLQSDVKTDFPLKREDALKIIVDNLQPDDIVVSTTGKTSRELFEYRERCGQGHHNDFLTVGSMGHSSQIALGVAFKKLDRTVYCIDGDGAVIMHMGSLAIIGTTAPENFKHIIINNGSHESVGGQPTAGFNIDIIKIAKGCGYKITLSAESENEIKKSLQEINSSPGPSLLEIKVNKGARKDLGRPTSTPIENKKSLMKYLS